MAKKSSKDVPVSTETPSQPAEARSMSPFREFERMLDTLFDRGGMPSRWEQNPLWQRFAAFEKGMPKVDVIERDAEVVVRAEVPGFERDELDVSVTDGAVTIKGDHREESKEEQDEYVHSEISRGSFTRTVSLPSEIDGDKAAASFKNGVLELTLPKRKKANRRKVEVK
ncbi:HSP20 family protein [Halomonas fontilapidosi]|uniref:HSP20 family protein n=1 Tax=Halomonas fontilapidosi TaxID=616675 RepID=A0A7W5GXS2_9GAMM|nr:Hsp20/alpha crystallin family protein [Halomonas fontilapidosi]MBB3183648.1 HSP20 family protein [Halomonas fontilapidosi]